MNKYVELYKRHEVLDILRIRGSIEGIDKRELLSLVFDAPPLGYIGTLTFGKFRLGILHYGDGDCLASRFKTEAQMEEFIYNNLDIAFEVAVKKIDDYVYYINIIPHDYYGDGNVPDGADTPPKYLNKHIAPYMPIIQKFMVDALTDNLYIVENGELVKQ